MAKKQPAKKRSPRTQPKSGYIEYTLKQKMQALTILKQNDYNYSRTVRQTNVSGTTLRRWNSQYGVEMNKATISKEMAESVTDDMAKRNGDFFDTLFEVKELILSRMLEIVQDERNLDNLQKTLKTLCEIDGSSRKSAEEEPQGTVINIYEQINNQLIQNHYEPKSFPKPVGHIQE